MAKSKASKKTRSSGANRTSQSTSSSGGGQAPKNAGISGSSQAPKNAGTFGGGQASKSAGASATAQQPLEPISPPDLAETQPYNLIDEIGLEAYKALNSTPLKMPTYSEYRYDERFQEAQLVLKTMGIGQYTTWEQWAARFAWWQWQEDDPVVLEAVKEWWADRGQADYIARDAALMTGFEAAERERRVAEAADGRIVGGVRYKRRPDDSKQQEGDGEPTGGGDDERDPKNWSDYEDIQALMGTIDVVAYVMNPSDSGLTNNEFAALMIATLHEEARLRRRNGEISQWGGTVKDLIGDVLGLYFHQDRSTGIANLRPSVVNEILLYGVIPLPDNNNIDIKEEVELVPQEEIAGYGLPAGVYTRFDTQAMANLQELYAPASDSDNLIYDGEFYFLQSDNASLWLMGANLSRGRIRAQASGLEPSVFNISTWWNKGIQHSVEFERIEDEEKREAFDHANRVIQSYLAIAYYGTFDLVAGTEILLNSSEEQYLTDETRNLLTIRDD